MEIGNSCNSLFSALSSARCFRQMYKCQQFSPHFPILFILFGWILMWATRTPSTKFAQIEIIKGDNYHMQ